MEAEEFFTIGRLWFRQNLTPRYKTRNEWEADQKERIREQKVIKAEQESVILDFWSRYQDYRKAEDENETEEEESLKEELKKLRQWRKQVHWD